jgi:raffinose/stachyose/melibiose transport system substrate-binding protein
LRRCIGEGFIYRKDNAMTRIGGAGRTVLAVTVVAALALTAGCSGQGNAASTGDADSGTLTVLWREGQADGLKAVIAEFEKQNPDATVEVTYAEGDAYLAAIRTQLQAGTAPDVLHVWPGNGNVAATIPLAENGSLMDLSDEPWVDSLSEEIAPYTQYDGKTYSFPSTLSIIGAVYNNAALAASGLEIPETWSDVIQFCEDARDQGTVAFSVGLTSTHESQFISYALYPQLVQGPDPDLDERIAAGETTFADSGWKEALDKNVEMAEAGCFNDSAQGADMFEASRIMSEGESIGMVTIGQYMPIINNPDLTLAPLPGSDDPTESRIAVAPSTSAAVNAKAKNPALAKAFVAFLATPEMNELFECNTAGGIGSLPTVVEGAGKCDDSPFDVTAVQFLEEGRTGGFPDQTWPSPDVQMALQLGMQEAVFGGRTVDSVLQDMNDALLESTE